MRVADVFNRSNRWRTVWVVALCIVLAGCAGGKSNVSPSASNGLTPQPTSSSGTPSDPAGLSPKELLSLAQKAAENMDKYAFELQMSQKLSGADEAEVKINMQGRTERDPLKLDQTINSDIDGEASTLRTLVVPDAYYMYLPEFEEWSKLSKEMAEENRQTLSDFQVDPPRALQAIAPLAGLASAEKQDQTVTIRYEGTGSEATAYVAGLLDSTLGLSSLDKRVQESLEIDKLSLSLVLDAERHWPLSYRIETAMSLEFEPGARSAVSQTVAGTYAKHNAIAAIAVPEAAKEALDPDEIAEELDLGGE